MQVGWCNRAGSRDSASESEGTGDIGPGALTVRSRHCTVLVKISSFQQSTLRSFYWQSIPKLRAGNVSTAQADLEIWSKNPGLRDHSKTKMIKHDKT